MIWRGGGEGVEGEEEAGRDRFLFSFLEGEVVWGEEGEEEKEGEEGEKGRRRGEEAGGRRGEEARGRRGEEAGKRGEEEEENGLFEGRERWEVEEEGGGEMALLFSVILVIFLRVDCWGGEGG